VTVHVFVSESTRSRCCFRKKILCADIQREKTRKDRASRRGRVGRREGDGERSSGRRTIRGRVGGPRFGERRIGWRKDGEGVEEDESDRVVGRKGRSEGEGRGHLEAWVAKSCLAGKEGKKMESREKREAGVGIAAPNKGVCTRGGPRQGGEGVEAS